MHTIGEWRHIFLCIYNNFRIARKMSMFINIIQIVFYFGSIIGEGKAFFTGLIFGEDSCSM